MSVRTLFVGCLGLAAAVWVYGALHVPQPFVSANPVDSGEARVAEPVAVAQADSLTQAAPRPTIRRPRDATPSTPQLELPLPIPEVTPSAPRYPDFRSTPKLPTPIPIPDSLDPFSGPASDAPAFSTLEAPADATTVDPAPLRRELMQLLGEKADLLTVPQLQAAIIRTEREIREFKAQDRLERLRHELEILSRQYPQTWGGDAAQKLFNVPLPTVGSQSDRLEISDPSRAPTWRPDPLSPQDAPSFAPATPTPVRRRSS